MFAVSHGFDSGLCNQLQHLVVLRADIIDILDLFFHIIDFVFSTFEVNLLFLTQTLDFSNSEFA